MNKPLIVARDTPAFLQIGRIVFKCMVLKKNFTSFNLCCQYEKILKFSFFHKLITFYAFFFRNRGKRDNLENMVNIQSFEENLFEINREDEEIVLFEEGLPRVDISENYFNHHDMMEENN